MSFLKETLKDITEQAYMELKDVIEISSLSTGLTMELNDFVIVADRMFPDHTCGKLIEPYDLIVKFSDGSCLRRRWTGNSELWYHDRDFAE